jgi:hypothetical protein
MLSKKIITNKDIVSETKDHIQYSRILKRTLYVQYLVTTWSNINF